MTHNDNQFQLSPDDQSRLERTRGLDLAPSTHKAYDEALRTFTTWCSRRNYPGVPSPIPVICAYLQALAEGSVEGTKGRLQYSSIRKHLAALVHHHGVAGIPIHEVRDHYDIVRTMRAIRRSQPSTPAQKDAATPDVVVQLVDALPREHAVRNKAMLLLGFAGAFRRSELVSLRVEDVVSVTEEGLVVLLRRSKEDQEGKGFLKKISRSSRPEYCPVEALLAWCRLRPRSAPWLFPSTRLRSAPLQPRYVATVVKRCALAAGLDPSKFAGQSLRAGFVTSSYRAGNTLREIQEITGHKSLSSLEMYIRAEGNWKAHPGKGLL